MMNQDILGPVFTEKSILKDRVVDPLGIDQYRNRLLYELIYPIPPFPVTMRYRYFSYFAWLLKNDPEVVSEICEFEKIFLLANLLLVDDANFEKKGLPGADNVSKEIFSKEIIDLNEIMIHQSGSCGFWAYYVTPLLKGFLIGRENDKLILSPLCQKLADTFQKTTNLDFKELRSHVKSKKVPISYLQEISKKISVEALRKEEPTKDERYLLRKILFYLFDFEPKGTLSKTYFTIHFIEMPPTFTFKAGRKKYLDTLDETEKELLKWIKENNILEKNRSSLTLFLWYVNQYQNTNYGKEFTEISPPEKLQEIHNLWREVVFYEFMTYALEYTLYYMTSQVFTDLTLQEIIESLISESFEQTLKELTSKKYVKEIPFLEFFRQGVYFNEGGIPPEKNPLDTKISLETSIKDIINLIRNLPSSSLYLPNELNCLYYLKNNMRNHGKEISSNFAAILILYLLLKYRTRNNMYIVPPEFSKIKENDLQKFLVKLINTTVKRHIEVSYRKAPNHGGVPPLFFTIERGMYKYLRPFSGSVGPTPTKYQRLFDVLYETGLITSRNPMSNKASLTIEGEEFLSKLLGDPNVQ